MAKDTGHLKPTKQQLDRLARCGYCGPAPQTRDEYLRIWEDLEPPTEGQVDYLKNLGYTGPMPKSKKEATAILTRLVGPMKPREVYVPPPATPRQIRFLAGLGIPNADRLNKDEAIQMLDALLEKERQSGTTNQSCPYCRTIWGTRPSTDTAKCFMCGKTAYRCCGFFHSKTVYDSLERTVQAEEGAYHARYGNKSCEITLTEAPPRVNYTPVTITLVLFGLVVVGVLLMGFSLFNPLVILFLFLMLGVIGRAVYQI